jgi:hypothetical protein
MLLKESLDVSSHLSFKGVYAALLSRVLDYSHSLGLPETEMVNDTSTP